MYYCYHRKKGGKKRRDWSVNGCASRNSSRNASRNVSKHPWTCEDMCETVFLLYPRGHDSYPRIMQAIIISYGVIESIVHHGETM